MRCKRCLRVFRGPFSTEGMKHSWSKQECGKCHYLGIHGRSSNETKAGPRRGTGTKSRRVMDMGEHYHKVKITNNNIDLYCKISQIIRGKPCSNRKQLLNVQKIYKLETEVLP